MPTLPEVREAWRQHPFAEKRIMEPVGFPGRVLRHTNIAWMAAEAGLSPARLIGTAEEHLGELAARHVQLPQFENFLDAPLERRFLWRPKTANLYTLADRILEVSTRTQAPDVTLSVMIAHVDTHIHGLHDYYDWVRTLRKRHFLYDVTPVRQTMFGRPAPAGAYAVPRLYMVDLEPRLAHDAPDQRLYPWSRWQYAMRGLRDWQEVREKLAAQR